MPDDIKAIELWPCRYDAACRVNNCKAKATIIARSVDAGGRPLRQYEVCQPHADREKGRGREVVKREVG